MKRYQRVFQENDYKKYFDSIYIDFQNTSQLKVQRKGKVVLVNLPKDEQTRKTFREILFDMTKTIDNNNFDNIESNNEMKFTFLLDDNPEIIFNNVQQLLINMFPKDKEIKKVVNTDEFKKYVIQQYGKNI